ncbi:MAG: alpha/beta hydrolase, partial [Planctomycetota bacterium]
QKPEAAKAMEPKSLAFWVKDPKAREAYIEAFERSSMEGMLNYYKANYPREPYEESEEEMPPIQCSVLMIHGLQDTALLPGALNDTWQWIKKDLTLVTIPEAGHFVQQDAAEMVTETIDNWLKIKTGG